MVSWDISPLYIFNNCKSTNDTALTEVLKSKAERVTSELLTQSIVVRQIYLEMHLHIKGTAICLRVSLHLQVRYIRL